MRKVLYSIAAFLFAGLCTTWVAKAADKGAPATLEQIMALKDPSKSTCYLEASVAGTALKSAPREAQGGIGGGCDAVLANLLIGGGIRADWADWRNAGSIFAKMGVMLNSGAAIYGIAEWKVPEWKIKDAGQLALGAGAELKLELINPNFWIFGEGTVAASKFGPLATKDDVTARIGARYKF